MNISVRLAGHHGASMLRQTCWVQSCCVVPKLFTFPPTTWEKVPASFPARCFTTNTPAAACASSKGGKPRKTDRKRLDEACVERNPHLSRNVVQSWILQGKVFVDGRPVVKAGTPVFPTSKIEITAADPKYVCRAGLKLEAALAHFGVDPTGMVCLDSGQSTGGFTDCLLQHGAAHVYGVDVGYGQVADKLRRDARVTVIERFNLRYLKPSDLPTPVHLATLDLAFISVLKVLPAVVGVLCPPPDGQLLVLIKPQFEAGQAQVCYGGVVRDPKVHREVIDNVTSGVCALGFVCRGVIESPLKGDKSGNTEFLGHFVRGAGGTAHPGTVPAAAPDTGTGCQPLCVAEADGGGGGAGHHAGSHAKTIFSASAELRGTVGGSNGNNTDSSGTAGSSN